MQASALFKDLDRQRRELYDSQHHRVYNWTWTHDPESYAYEHYEAMADTIKKGIPFDKITTVSPNYLSGYKYEL
ncbi:hypothetical protein F5Y19DRAFT_471383 [Xylariaceae sp. FL1651]|nr:hypothetical protein F5Y19DRAFT_471383 [Xylariaceae sp. FL1651]